MEREFYSIDEIDRLKGRRVRLAKPMLQRYVGETGTVTEVLEFELGYVPVVTWDLHYGSGRERIDPFPRSDFNALLTEI